MSNLESKESNISEDPISAVNVVEVADVPESIEADIFTEDIKPTKKWYKRWWLYIYLVIFITSLVILAVYADTTDKIFNTFSVDTVTDSISDTIIVDSFTKAPELTDSQKGSEDDFLAIHERLRFVDGSSIGNPDAPIVIAEFSDFQCPFCRKAFPIMKQVITKYIDNVRFVYIDFPIESIHPLSFVSAHAARCAGDQGKFWEYHDSLFQNQDKLNTELLATLAGLNDLDVDDFDRCMDSGKYNHDIVQQFELGRELGVVGTPTFFVNGHRLPGVIPLETWTQIIDLILYN